MKVKGTRVWNKKNAVNFKGNHIVELTGELVNGYFTKQTN